MKNLFDNIINIQPGISIAIAMLLILRPLLKKHYTARLNYMLWAIIALRMLLTFDVNGLFDKQPPVNIEIQPAYVDIHRNIPSGGPSISVISRQLYTGIQQPVHRPVDYDRVTSLPDMLTAVRQTDPLPTTTQLTVAIWQVITISAIAITIAAYFIAKRDILKTKVYDINLYNTRQSVKSDMGINRKVDIAYCCYNGSPMLIGLLKPVIVVPKRDYTPQATAMIIRHELCHLKHGDILYKLALHIIKCLYWFNPLVWVMVKKRSEDIELYCDEGVIKNKTPDFKAEYATAILQVVSVKRNIPVLSTAFSQTAATIKERFGNIFVEKIKRQGKAMAPVFLATVIAATTFVGCGEALLPTHKPQVYSLINTSYGYGFVSGSGFYTLAHSGRHPDCYVNIVKGDLHDFGGIDYLCNLADCTHSDENCTSYISSCETMLTLLADGKTILYEDKIHTYADTVPVTYHALYTMDINGENRRLLYVMDDGYTYTEGYRHIAYTDNKLYIPLRGKGTYQNGKYQDYNRILELDLYNSKSRLIDVDGKEEITIVGAAKNTLYYLIYNSSQRNCDLYRFNIEKNTHENMGIVPIALIFDSNPVSQWPYVYDNKLFIADRKGNNGRIIAYDFDNDGETVTIADNIPLRDSTYFTLAGVKNNTVLMREDGRSVLFKDGDNQKHFVYDMEKDKIAELELMRTNSIFPTPVDVVDRFENSYIVALDDGLYISPDGNTDNEYNPGDGLLLKYYLINKYDYFSNNPEYTPLDVRLDTEGETE